MPQPAKSALDLGQKRNFNLPAISTKQKVTSEQESSEKSGEVRLNQLKKKLEDRDKLILKLWEDF